ncbi:MAG: phosphoribosylformylglycinamidine synthase subunit PurQ [Dehalococcoidales bacterium]|nr:phosphoribosylformylglycinamidine synthase subunit PurQ [Dehalococcoidales bacterium]
MTKVRTLILRGPGTNCDAETAFAFQRAGADVTSAHINQLIRREVPLSDYQIFVITGGFTYGDDISAGKVLANELKLKLGQDIRSFIDRGGLILGICNGFQVLVKAGFLPGGDGREQPITLSTNDSGRFECRWVYLKVNESSPCIFTEGIDRMYLPVANGEGKVVTGGKALPDSSIVLTYSDQYGNNDPGYPDDPSGSEGHIAGICDASGRIFALMPHPERHIRGTQHPRWTREGVGKDGDGLPVFLNAVKWAKGI